ncbi:MAG: class I SAM-dependent methyltransferase [Candidatus Saliniplasma sp.]
MRKFDPKQADYLDSKDRRERMEPQDILSLLDLDRDDIVLDLGAGTGFLTFPISERVNEGKVYAVDVQEEMLEKLRERCDKHGCGNIELLLNEEGSIPLPDSEIDKAFLMNVLHEIEDMGTFVELYRVLKKDGKICVIDWDKEGGSAHGPPTYERYTLEEAVELLGRYGFEELDSGRDEDHYFLCLSK